MQRRLLARLVTTHRQSWDVPLDAVAAEQGVHRWSRRDWRGLSVMSQEVV